LGVYDALMEKLLKIYSDVDFILMTNWISDFLFKNYSSLIFLVHLFGLLVHVKK